MGVEMEQHVRHRLSLLHGAAVAVAQLRADAVQELPLGFLDQRPTDALLEGWHLCQNKHRGKERKKLLLCCVCKKKRIEINK